MTPTLDARCSIHSKSTKAPLRAFAEMRGSQDATSTSKVPSSGCERRPAPSE